MGGLSQKPARCLLRVDSQEIFPVNPPSAQQCIPPARPRAGQGSLMSWRCEGRCSTLMDNPPSPAPSSRTKAPSLGNPGRSFPSTFQRKKKKPPSFLKTCLRDSPSSQGDLKRHLLMANVILAPGEKSPNCWALLGARPSRIAPRRSERLQRKGRNS